MVATRFKGVLYHRKDGKIFFTKKFLLRAATFIHIQSTYANKYQVCECHWDYHTHDSDDYDDDEYEDYEFDNEETTTPNLFIEKQPIITVRSNDFTKYGIYLSCTDCGCSKTIDLDIFVDLIENVVIIKDVDKFMEEYERDNHTQSNSNVKQIPMNKKPRIKYDKTADVINLMDKKETQ